MTVTIAPDRLIGAGYMFFLSGQVDPLGALREYLAGKYGPGPANEVFELGLDVETRIDTYVASDGNPVRLDMRRHSLENAVCVSLASYIDSNEEAEWARQIRFLEGCREAMALRGGRRSGDGGRFGRGPEHRRRELRQFQGSRRRTAVAY